MRAAALNPNQLVRLTTEGVAEMRGLLTPEECEALSAPENVAWNTEEADDPSRSWSHSPEYRYGDQASEVSTALQDFLTKFRELVHVNASIAVRPELAKWGNPSHSEYRAALLGLRRIVYGGKWHRTPASHEIGWHSDDTFDLADRSRGDVPNRALGMMVAINLSELGGAYEYAPSYSAQDEETGAPVEPTLCRRIDDIQQGDAIAFCTAKSPSGDRWQGSFPLHRFVSHGGEPEQTRESLVVYYRYVADHTIKDLGVRGIAQLVKTKILER